MRWGVLLLVLLAVSTAVAEPRPPDPWIEKLASPDAEVAAAAVRALRARFAEGSLRPDELVRIALMPPLAGEPEVVRKRAKQAAMDLGLALRPVVGLLLGEAVSDDAHRRTVAADILADNLGRRVRRHRTHLVGERLVTKPLLAPAQFEAVRRVLMDSRLPPWTRKAIADSMSELGLRVFELFPALSSLMDELTQSFYDRQAELATQGIVTTAHAPRPSTRWGISLAELGTAAVPHFVEALMDDDPRIADIGESALQWLEDEAISGLLPHLQDPDPKMRARVLGALDRVETMTPALLLALEKAEKDQYPAVRAAARATLAAIPGAHADVRLEAAIRSDDAAARHKALYELAWRGRRRTLSRSLEQAIVEVLRKDPLTEWNSLRRLVPALGPLAVPVTKQVFAGIASRRRVLDEPRTIGRDLGEGAIPHLVDLLLTTDDARIQDIATRTLVFSYDTLPDESNQRLATYLAANPRDARALFVATALAHPGDTLAEPVLLRALPNGKDWNRRSFAALGLGRLGATSLKHVDAILKTLREIEAEIDATRWQNQWGHLIRTERGLMLLLVHDPERAVLLLGHERSRNVREAARDALKKLDPADVEARLAQAWDDQTPAFQREVLDHWRAEAFLARGLQSPFPTVQAEAAEHSILVDALRAEALEVCVRLMLDPVHEQYGHAAMVLEHAQQRDDEQRTVTNAILAKLRPHLDHHDEIVRKRIRKLVQKIEDAR